MRRHVLAGLLGIAVLLPATSASARLSEEYTYTYDQLWSAAVRLIAVDFRFPIEQRDEEIGFLLFRYRDNGREFNGSLELVRFEGPHGTPQVRVTMQVPQMPSYVERMLIDRFTRKLSTEYGQPPPTRRAAPPSPPVADADDEEGDDDGSEDEG